MAKLLKLIAVLLLALLIAVLAFTLTFDPNQHKQRITSLVEEHTGRQLEIAGDIGLSVFPWIGVQVEKISLANAHGFSEENFASVASLDIRMALLPLLQKQFVVKTIRLNGLVINLEKNAAGKNNWSDLAGGEKVVETPDPEEIPAGDSLLAAVAVNGLEIRDASLLWKDDSTKSQTRIDNMNLTTGAISPGSPIDVEFSVHVQQSAPALDVNLKMTSVVEYDVASQRYQFNGLNVQVSAEGDSLPGGRVDATLGSDVVVNLAQKTAQLKTIQLNSMGVTVLGDTQVYDLDAEPKVNGQLRVSEFNARNVLHQLNIELPDMSDPSALAKVSASMAFNASTKKVKINNLQLRVDESNVKGALAVNDLGSMAIAVKMHLDHIDLDRYLPSAPAVTPESSTAPVASDLIIALPMEMLRSLNMSGDFSADKITLQGNDITKLVIGMKASNGIVNVKPLTLNVLQGTASVNASIDARQNIPAYSAVVSASQLQASDVVSPMLRKLLGDARVSLKGRLKLGANIQTRGEKISQLKKALNGRVSMDMAKTVLQGVDVDHYVRNAVLDWAQGKGLAVDKKMRGTRRAHSETAFDTFHASANIRNGVVDNRDMLLQGKRLKVTGAGTVNLGADTMDYRTVVDLAPSRSKTTVEKLLDEPQGVIIRGPFTNLDIKLDTKLLKRSLENLLKAEAKRKLKKEVKRQEEKVKKKIEEKGKQELKKLFKKLF